MTYKISKTELEVSVKESVEEILADKINWKHAFGTTVRRNGDVIEKGEARDTIDTRDTIDRLEVYVAPDRIGINFTNEDAEAIFGWRGEIDDLTGNTIVEELAVDVVQYVLQFYFK